MASNSYPKSEKLKSRNDIKLIFEERQNVSKYPLRLAYFLKPTDKATLNIGVSVSKRHFKNATDRNRIKRLLREAYRLNKDLLLNGSTSYEAKIMIMYQNKEMPKAPFINKKMIQLFEKFNEQINSNKA